jgi:hypothetical protein
VKEPRPPPAGRARRHCESRFRAGHAAGEFEPLEVTGLFSRVELSMELVPGVQARSLQQGCRDCRTTASGTHEGAGPRATRRRAVKAKRWCPSRPRTPDGRRRPTWLPSAARPPSETRRARPLPAVFFRLHPRRPNILLMVDSLTERPRDRETARDTCDARRGWPRSVLRGPLREDSWCARPSSAWTWTLLRGEGASLLGDLGVALDRGAVHSEVQRSDVSI